MMAIETVSARHAAPGSMVELMRSHLMPVQSAPYQLAVAVDDYLDDYGVIRRASTVGIASSVLACAESSEAVDLQAFTSAAAAAAAAQTSDEASGSNTGAPSDAQAQQDESAEERCARRKVLVARLRERKRELLRAQSARTQERLELWYEASELDPDVETSPRHTIRSPSTRAQSFIDADGNIRRKSCVNASEESNGASPPPSPSRQRSQSSPHKALVLEFVQAIIDD